MLVTTNQMVTQWGTVFGDDVLAAAILDRLLHHSHALLIQGESYRLKQKRKAGLLGSASAPPVADGALWKLPLLWTAKRRPPTGAWKTLRVSHSSHSTLFKG